LNSLAGKKAAFKEIYKEGAMIGAGVYNGDMGE